MGGLGCGGVCGTTRSLGLGVEITTVSPFLSDVFPELARFALSEVEDCAKTSASVACNKLSAITMLQKLSNRVVRINCPNQGGFTNQAFTAKTMQRISNSLDFADESPA